jgi:Tfp pilus assembly protein FimT
MENLIRINKKKTLAAADKRRSQRGVSLPELVIVFFVIAIIVVLALPQILSSRRLFRFSGMQRQVVASLREARQEAMSQRAAVTFRYDDASKQLVIYGGSFGARGDAKNRALSIADEGLTTAEVVYGRPAGAPVAALGDTSNLTALTDQAVEITFQPDGSVVDDSDVPVNKALFFYNSKNPAGTAFAVSVLGAGGRVKIWRYSQGVNAYVE